MKDLFDVIGEVSMVGFCAQPTAHTQYDEGVYYWDWEEKVAKPALEALGYTSVMFRDGERDSFGPLTRKVIATSPEGKFAEFIYG